MVIFVDRNAIAAKMSPATKDMVVLTKNVHLDHLGTTVQRNVHSAFMVTFVREIAHVMTTVISNMAVCKQQVRQVNCTPLISSRHSHSKSQVNQLCLTVKRILPVFLSSPQYYFCYWRSRAKSWTLYSCPLPANTIALETAQEDDYTLLTDRIQLPRCEMNGR
ncbi:uncharacterized protein LOC133202482 [Saccostrea echinata]|uniref:uncharacterized protein LOC133202482 n=1 Tax=Saccostrea echinata TaxID=191078 RepID=UPI002A82FFEC|nr:uncharacterized protein LOC133202482 [Saccostrea echinata]